jgi:hypothetical protein
MYSFANTVQPSSLIEDCHLTDKTHLSVTYHYGENWDIATQIFTLNRT